ncbi:MAG: class I SAM-dependent DNA methyltransferase [Clostridia bacterium]|nr:class I SAM-dependent DNA methyltransferase [Clostridia bacterium]
MTEKEQRQGAKQFIEFWKDKGYEKGQSQQFWIQLLTDIFRIKNTSEFIEFEDQVHIDKSTGFIDAYIPSTRVLIEQKSINKDLRKAIKQSDGSLLTPFQQAKKYIAELPVSKHPKWVITCNFKSFLIYDMENPNGEPEEILLENLEKEYYRLQFLVDSTNENLKKEMEVSIKAGELVGKIYDEILPLYKDPKNEDTLKSLNMLCVRLVFCLYAEDAGLFGKRSMFHDYLARFEAEDLRRALIDLFKVLDTKIEDRDPYMKEDLSQFPYVNGGLFADENIEIPMLNEKIKEIILAKASEDFDWSDISPTIFGAVFESTLNPETRRKGGMHYTSIENIHKVIDPLFFDELKKELEEKVLNVTTANTIKKNVSEFQDKISKLKFLDPACGSGNFLTETYLSLRKLENQALEKLYGNQIQFGDEKNNPIKVSISQFYGIEINDFAVTVAKTALWIAESQMMKETESILHLNLDFLPLKSYTNIIEGNALKIDWNDVVPKEKLNYIMGNPPFVGKKEQNKTQKEDLKEIFSSSTKKTGILDYVTGWFFLASKFIKTHPSIKCAFVSTDSICQGEHVPNLWKILFNENNIKIDFAYKTFKWNNEAKEKAEVYCIIVGFSSKNLKDITYTLYQNNHKKIVNNINAYLLDAPNVWLEARNNQISGYNKIFYGSMPIDNGFLILSIDEYEKTIIKEPHIKQYIRKYAGAEEILKGKIRYCLWLKDVSRKEILSSHFISERVSNCKQFRESSNREATKKLAQTPELFGEIRQPKETMIVIPKVSSKHRRYIPITLIDSKEYIINGSSLIIPNGNLLEFGILSSNVHNSWIRAIAETWGHSFQYSTDIYNTFPIPNINKNFKKNIEITAKKILDIRNKHSDLTLAEMYNPKLGIISDLLTAHQENDKAVMEAYGFDWRNMTESDCVAELMKMYQKLVEEKVEKKK